MSGFSTEGLAIEMQLVGRPFAESRLLEIGVACETAAGFKRRLRGAERSVAGDS